MTLGVLCLILFLPLLVGCGVTSLYDSANYSETRLGVNLLRVTFRGGEPPLAGELCLLRCAELCREAGYSHFEVVDSETGNSLDGFASPYPFHRHYHLDEPFVQDRPYVTKTIRLRKDHPEVGFAYDAREIEGSLRRKYEIKK